MTRGSKVIFGILEDQRRTIRISPRYDIIKVINMLKAVPRWGEADSRGYFRFGSLVVLPLCDFLKLI